MAKKDFKEGIAKSLTPTKTGMDNVFSPTTEKEKGKTVEIGEAEKETAGRTVDTETRTGSRELPKAAAENVLVGYHIRYPKELQKRIKRFCIEHDGIDMKDVFTNGAIMYLDTYDN